MKRFRWAAIGTAILSLFAGAPDLVAASGSGSVSVSARVQDPCTPSATNLQVGAYAVRSTPYAGWIAAYGSRTGAEAAGASDRPANPEARGAVCRVSLQQAVAPAALRGDLVVTVNF